MDKSVAIRRPRARWSEVVALSLLAVATAALIAPAVAHAIDLWSTTEEFSYGFLVVPISVALVVLRGDRLRAAGQSGDRFGLAAVAAAVAGFAVAERVGIHALAGLMISPLLWGITLYLFGRGVAGAVAFPIGFLAFGFAPYRGLLDSVGFTLQGVTAQGAAALAAGLGLPIVQNGLVLQLPQFGFIVAEACSGMSSLLSLLALASVWIHLAHAGVPSRIAVILSILPIVIAANILRVALVLVVAVQWGPDAAVGFFHGASSFVLFGAAVASLIVISRVVGCRLHIER